MKLQICVLFPFLAFWSTAGQCTHQEEVLSPIANDNEATLTMDPQLRDLTTVAKRWRLVLVNVAEFTGERDLPKAERMPGEQATVIFDPVGSPDMPTEARTLTLNLFDDVDVVISIGDPLPIGIEGSLARTYGIELPDVVDQRLAHSYATIDRGNVSISRIPHDGLIYALYPLHRPSANESAVGGTRRGLHVVLELDPKLPGTAEVNEFREPEWTEDQKQRFRKAARNVKEHPERRLAEYHEYLIRKGYSDNEIEKKMREERKRLNLD